MSELIRTFTSRAVEVLNGNNINAFGIQTHSPSYQSVHYVTWLNLCKEKKTDQLKSDMITYLRSTDSIKKIDDLGVELAKATIAFLSAGNEITKEKSYQIIKDVKLESLFGKDKSKYSVKRTALADTMLCLAHLKSLSHKSNLDYSAVLRIMSFVERCMDFKMDLPELNILSHFNKPILLPSCFSKIDPCEFTQSTSPFPYLDELNIQQRPGDKIIKGCLSDNCTCKLNEECVEQSHCCAKVRIDLIDLMIVKDYTKCYQAGELSYIKNILEGETLSTRHRRFERTEELTESESEVRTFEEKYLQTEEKASLQKEAEKIVKSDSALNAGVTATADWGTYSVVADTKYSNNQSKALTNKEVVNSSKDIIARASKQVEEKIKTLISTKRILEIEENNEHSFVNTKGPNISGQYLYVNKISRAQVYNYGRKAVIDILLPEPASLFKKLLKNEFKGDAPSPVTIDPKTITPENYKELVKQYELKKVPIPPEFSKNVVTKLQGFSHGAFSSGNNTYVFSCVVPDNYVGTHMSAEISDYSGGSGIISIIMGPDQNTIWYDNITGNNSLVSVLPAMEGTIPFFVHTVNVLAFTWKVTVKCELKDELKTQWQMEVYNMIVDKNEKDIAEYQKAKTDFEEKEAELRKERYNKNPFINRETEKAELKRMVISYISCQFYDQFDAMKNKVKPCGYPEMNIREAEQEGKFIQFFEQAFNWNLMTYIFYPYFWGKKCTWADKLKEESNDLIFEKFLAAGSCRALVPIRDGYFDYVSWFLASGEIWGSNGTPPLPNDPHYVSLAQEIKEQKQNFYADREGSLDATNGVNTVVLNNSDYFWDYGDPTIPTPAGLNTVNINADIDREIIIDCIVYRIVDIQPNPGVPTPTSWIITLDRNYEAATASNMKWSTGAVFVGAPWEFITPTTLTFLRDKSSCLPCYPLKECIESKKA